MKGSGVRMMTSMETYLRHGRRQLQRLMLNPGFRTGAVIAAYGGGGFFLSAASLNHFAQPLAMGCICALTGWQSVVMTLGAMLGYPTFWGRAGLQGIVWSAAGLVLALLLGKRKALEDQPLLLPAVTAVMAAVTGLAFRFFLEDNTPFSIYILRTALAAGAAWLFARAQQKRDAFTEWILGGVGVLALAQVLPIPNLGFGYVAAGVLAMGSAFPGAALAGLGLDLAQITQVPMTAVLCIAYFLRMIPFERRWVRYLSPGAACVMTMAVSGLWDFSPLPGLFLGGALGCLLPPRPEVVHRRGETGIAQVRLELGAEMLAQIQQLFLEDRPVPIDREALLDKAREHSCAGCSARKSCAESDKLSVSLLEHPLDANCRKSGRLIPELRRAQEQLRCLTADHRRREEYRWAMVQQYQFLAEYLRSLSDQLPRRGDRKVARYCIEVSARSAAREKANGDKCLAFSGAGCRYFVLLCDGMGTGVGAADAGQSAAQLLRQMLSAGFPPEYALRSLNSILALRGKAGAVTVDLAEVHLDTGQAAVYKWGAAPSYILRRTGAEKIGTATPPPGISVTGCKETVEKLSLCRGETLILLSDGVEVGETLRREGMAPDAPPGEIAAKLLERHSGQEDDATVAVIRLRPGSLAT